MLYFTNLVKRSLVQTQQVDSELVRVKGVLHQDREHPLSLPSVHSQEVDAQPYQIPGFCCTYIWSGFRQSEKQVFHVSGDLVNCSRYKSSSSLKRVGL